MSGRRKIAVMVGLLMMASVSVVGATFHPGDRGSQITEIQQALVQNGSDILVDGDYGTGTQVSAEPWLGSRRNCR